MVENFRQLFKSIQLKHFLLQFSVLMDKPYATYAKHLEDLIAKYNSARYNATTIYADPEYSGMQHLLLPTQLNICNMGDHIPEAESNNRTIAEQFRAAFHQSPFSAMPKVMT